MFVQTVRYWVLGGLGVALRAAAGDVPHCEAPQGRVVSVHSEGLGRVPLCPDTPGPRVSETDPP